VLDGDPTSATKPSNPDGVVTTRIVHGAASLALTTDSVLRKS
jgi:hypothetical protein